MTEFPLTSADQASMNPPTRAPLWCGTALALAAIFFVAEHELQFSLLSDYQPTSDQM